MAFFHSSFVPACSPPIAISSLHTNGDFWNHFARNSIGYIRCQNNTFYFQENHPLDLSSSLNSSDSASAKDCSFVNVGSLNNNAQVISGRQKQIPMTIEGHQHPTSIFPSTLPLPLEKDSLDDVSPTY